MSLYPGFRPVLFFIFVAAYVLLFTDPLYSQTADESWKVFDDTQMARIDITVDPAAVTWLYAHTDRDSEFVASVRFVNKYINESVDSTGFRLRGNTSRESRKKSFKISFNSFEKGKKFYGLEKLNLNGEHNDPSIIRSKLCYDHFQTAGITASRASHIEVYINGRYYGLYISVEHVDEEFLKRHFADDSGNLWKCLYPADLNYRGDDPQIYKNLMSGSTPVYELSTNENTDDYSQLARLIRILNTTPDTKLAGSLEPLLDIASVLKYLAMNILTGSWDSYWNLANNYYLYNDPSTGRFSIIPYDYDNSFGIAWDNNNWSSVNPYSPPVLNSGTKPLAQKLTGIARYRNLYTHFLEFYSSRIFSLNLWEKHLDSLKSMITPSALADSFRTLDYGFTESDFHNSYSALSYSKAHVRFGIKQFVNLRTSTLGKQLSYVPSTPAVYSFRTLPAVHAAHDSLRIEISAFSYAGISEATIGFRKKGSADETVYPMRYSPVANSGTVEGADRYTGAIPPLQPGEEGYYRIYVKDSKGTSQLYPELDSIAVSMPSEATDAVVINEFLADNTASATDPAGEHDDWVELYNRGDKAELMTGRYLTDNPSKPAKWKFSQDSLYIQPGAHLVVWLDEQPDQAGLHANFKLSKSGEFIALVDTDGVSMIDSLHFGPQTTDMSFGRIPDGSGSWSAMTPTPGNINNVTDVDNGSLVPLEFAIRAYPNPFNPQTTLEYTVGEAAWVSLRIYDILGRELASLVNEEKLPGVYKTNFNAAAFSSGIYFCSIQAGKHFRTIKLQLLK